MSQDMLLDLSEQNIVGEEERDVANTPTLPYRQPRMLSSSSESSDDDGENSSSSGGFDWSMYIDHISLTPERASSPILAGEAGGLMPVVAPEVEGSVLNLQLAGEAAENPEVNRFDVLSYFNWLSSRLIREGISRGEFSWLCFQINHRIYEILGDPDLGPLLDSSEDSSSEESSSEDSSSEDSSSEDSSSEDSSLEDSSSEDTSSEDTSSEDSSSEDSSFEKSSSEETSSEETSSEETSFADFSFEDSSFEDTAFDDTSFEETSEEETLEEETLLKETELEETKPGQD